MELETIVAIVVGVLVLAPALFFTWETSDGQGLALKAAKFLGLIASVFPLIGVALWRLRRDSESGYGQRCAVMAILGVFLMILSGTLGR